MLRKGWAARLPLWVYGAIAGLLIFVLIVTWPRTDTFSRAELLIPAVFWAATFIIIGLQRRSARS
ncbi:MAG: hypothetical protein QM773_10670 [Hyphomonadaceae bacterium]